MKRTTILIVIILTIMYLLYLTVGRGGSKVTEVRKSDGPHGEQYTNFTRHAYWPDKELLNTRKCRKSLIETDILTLSNTLATFLNTGLQPTARDIESVVGVPEYVDGDDYLFLRYTTKSGVEVEVQDGWGLAVVITCPNSNKVEFADIGMFVKDVASATINFPKETGIPENPVVNVFREDVGQARCGALHWKREGEPKGRQTDWASFIPWWSDGARVLFAISKLSKEDCAKIAEMAQPGAFRKPRRFLYRTPLPSLRELEWKWRHRRDVVNTNAH